jgi:hypothetical protein
VVRTRRRLGTISGQESGHYRRRTRLPARRRNELSGSTCVSARRGKQQPRPDEWRCQLCLCVSSNPYVFQFSLANFFQYGALCVSVFTFLLVLRSLGSELDRIIYQLIRTASPVSGGSESQALSPGAVRRVSAADAFLSAHLAFARRVRYWSRAWRSYMVLLLIGTTCYYMLYVLGVYQIVFSV